MEKSSSVCFTRSSENRRNEISFYRTNRHAKNSGSPVLSVVIKRGSKVPYSTNKKLIERWSVLFSLQVLDNDVHHLECHPMKA